MATKTLSARPGDERFTVRLQSPSAREAYRLIRHGRSQAATINDALTTAAGVDDAETALSRLMNDWGTSKSETVREALRRAATECEHE
jgi:hypothetical protein